MYFVNIILLLICFFGSVICGLTCDWRYFHNGAVIFFPIDRYWMMHADDDGISANTTRPNVAPSILNRVHILEA
jgi:hypothetical protein